ncbi:MAG: hypothetical protein DWQ01_04305 [Planctomycetota bacterium]|nr:MAG: hypothetical protein DWQ01_04305 [Planctomycetota bacterium]
MKPPSNSSDREQEALWDAVLHQAFPSKEGEQIVPEMEISKEADARPVQKLKHVGRYQIIHEIARGGFGVVYRARDPRLQRQVAIKILHPSQADPAWMKAFLEEAELAAQLQHPGIIPIYEVGVDGDYQPFLVMKLIEGGTLDAVFQNRQQQSRDRQLLSFLQILLAVSQAVAFAHSRQVLHLDLKPGNVLLGNYGEVIVTDWGLSHRADAAKGSRPFAAGTPAYRAPEQTAPNPSQWSPATDVFALGAILCEWLTGSPPFPNSPASPPSDSALELALSTCHQRLRQSQAEPELRQLALDCLQMEPKKRPPHAGEFALGLEACLTGLDQKRRRAEIAAARAESQAQAEKRTRRLTSALFLSLSILFLFAGRSWWRQQRQTLETRQRRQEQITEALQRAEAFSHKDAWQAMETALLPMPKWLQELPKEQAFRQRAEQSWKDLIQAGEQAQQERLEEIRRMDLQKQLEEAQVEWEEESWNIQATSAPIRDPYRAAFLQAGLAILEMSPEQAAAALLEFGPMHTETWIRALDHWAVRHPRSSFEHTTLLETADWLDQDPIRRSFRKALAEGQRRDLRASVRQIQWRQSMPGSLELLGAGLRRLGEYELARELLEQAAEHFPHDYWLHLELAKLYSAGYGRRSDHSLYLELAENHARLARALQPKSLHASQLLARTLLRQGRPQDALICVELSLEKQRHSPTLHLVRAQSLLEIGRREEARIAVTQALEISPDFPQALRLQNQLQGNSTNRQSQLGQRAEQLQQQGEVQKAADLYLQDLENLLHNQPGQGGLSLLQRRRNLQEAMAVLVQAATLESSPTPQRLEWEQGARKVLQDFLIRAERIQKRGRLPEAMQTELTRWYQDSRLQISRLQPERLHPDAASQAQWKNDWRRMEALLEDPESGQ